MKVNLVLHVEDDLVYDLKNGTGIAKILESAAAGVHGKRLNPGIKYNLSEPSGKVFGGILLHAVQVGNVSK